jgi:hypothetical protein
MANTKKELLVKCPRCGVATRWEGNADRPFCSLRCRQIDLGAWADEEYRVPVENNHSQDESDTSKISEKTTDWS